MRAIETTAKVNEDGTVTLQLPPEIGPGTRHFVVVVEDQLLPDEAPLWRDFPVRDYGPWPTDLSLRREDMYDEWGR